MATERGRRTLFGKIFTGVTATMVAGGVIDLLTKPFEDSSLVAGLLAMAAYLGAAFVVSMVWYGWLLRSHNLTPAAGRAGERPDAEPGAAPDTGRR